MLKKIVNISLAAILLVATTGVTLNKHYCMGRLKSVAINEHANHCLNEEDEPMPCCEDVSQKLKVEEVTQANFDFNAQPDLYQVAFITFFITEARLISQGHDHLEYYGYSPPLIDPDIQVRDQVFII